MSAPARSLGSETEREELRVVSLDGAEITLKWLPALGVERGVCLAVHGLLANSRGFERPRGNGFGAELARRGLHTYLMDMRGHGASSASRNWTYDHMVEMDLPAVVSALRERHPGMPVVGVGHSLSGTQMLCYQGVSDADASAGLDAIVTVCADSWQLHLDTALSRRLSKRLLVEAGVAVSSVIGHVPGKRLRLGSEDVSVPFMRDVLRWMRQGSWRSRTGVNYADCLARVKVPVLAALAEGDRFFCPPHVGRRFHEDIPDLELWSISSEEIGFRPGHMGLVVDPRARPFWQSAAQWAAAQCDKFGASIRNGR